MSITPNQIRTIDPFSQYNSNVINRMSYMISNSINCIVASNPISYTAKTDSTLTLSAGSCIKDNVLITVEETILDLTDTDLYISDDYILFNSQDGYWYVVLDYTYQKFLPVPTASYKLISPNQIDDLYDSTNYLLIHVIESNGGDFTNILDWNPSNISHRIFMSNTNVENIRTTTTEYDFVRLFDRYLFVDAENLYLLPAQLKSVHTIINARPFGSVTIHVNTHGAPDKIDNTFDTRILLTKNDNITLISDGSSNWIEI